MVGGMPCIRGRSLRKPPLSSSNTERHPATAVCSLDDNSLRGPFIMLEVHSEEVVKTVDGISLVVQWLRIPLPMQDT